MQMFHYFFNTICNNDEVIGKLKDYLNSCADIRLSAENAARFLVRTKNYSEFSSGIKSMQQLLRGSNQELSDLYPLMVLAAAAGLTKEQNERAGIPESITIETLKDTNIWLDNYYKTNGRYGLAEYPWLARHYAGNLFKIGRLQYEISLYPDWGYVFKNKETGRLVALSASAKISSSGHITGSSGEEDCVFQASFAYDGEMFEGNKIDTEKGIVLEDKVKLSCNEWDLILKPGDLVWNLHIPQGEKLEYEACLKSMKEAGRFFKAHFPELRFSAIICSSWLLDTNLVHILPENSYIVKFMRLWSKVPVHASVPMIFERVYGFGFKEQDIATAPENSSLQRNLKKYIMDGGKAYTTGGYIIL
jgi:hypothetical protein